MSGRRTVNCKRGFTLLELICVLFVLFLLFSLLMPSLSKVRKVATRVVCGTNMKGLGTVSILYQNDYDEHFPDPEQWIFTKDSNTPEHPMGCRWHDWPLVTDVYNSEHRGVIWDYDLSIKSLLCPGFRDIAKSRGCESPDHNPAIGIRPQYNYSMNAYLGSDRQGGVLNNEKVRKPSTIFFFAEENCWSVRPEHPKYAARWLKAPLSTKALDDSALLITPTPEAVNCFGTFHGASSKDKNDGSANLSYLDGHVGTISVYEQLRSKMHGKVKTRRSFSSSKYYDNPAGNLYYAWPEEEEPPGGWDAQ